MALPLTAICLQRRRRHLLTRWPRSLNTTILIRQSTALSNPSPLHGRLLSTHRSSPLRLPATMSHLQQSRSSSNSHPTFVAKSSTSLFDHPTALPTASLLHCQLLAAHNKNSLRPSSTPSHPHYLGWPSTPCPLRIPDSSNSHVRSPKALAMTLPRASPLLLHHPSRTQSHPQDSRSFPASHFPFVPESSPSRLPPQGPASSNCTTTTSLPIRRK